jgi:DNA-binding response OmpR family regulator
LSFNVFERTGGRHTKILIVEDNEGLSLIVREMLEMEGFEVRAASDGKGGYLSYLVFRPDLVLTDLHMPEQSGLELIQNIRRHDPDVKVIYMTGNISPFWEVLKEETARHHAGCLEKPFSRTELMRALSASLLSKTVPDFDFNPSRIRGN